MIRDDIGSYQKLDAKVFGISVDMPYSLAKFKEEQGYNIPLLSDFNKSTIRAYDTIHEEWGMGMKGLAKRLILPRWLRRYDTWHPVGSLARKYLETISGIQKPTFLFPYSVDVDWFARLSDGVRRQSSELRRKLGLKDKDFVVLGIMKWHQREDPLILLRAFNRLHRNHPEARLILVGDGPLRDCAFCAPRSSSAWTGCALRDERESSVRRT